jgi:hypothetical protein
MVLQQWTGWLKSKKVLQLHLATTCEWNFPTTQGKRYQRHCLITLILLILQDTLILL